MKSQLEVYSRIKPCSSKNGPFYYEIKSGGSNLEIFLDKSSRYCHHVNNAKDSIEFNFNKVFDDNCSQEEFFDCVARPVLMNCLEGYNGTIFAYGQTGSGKTYTMSGADSWQMRGIVPRVLSAIFDEFEKRTNSEYSMYISFMEIYNEQAFDLLDKKHIELPIENWKKIILFEDDFGNIHLKNLSVHKCNNEQEGIDLLMMGNFIRQVSSTPLNQCSSRSHCVFTISLEGRDLNSETGFVSKLHLVDLAGSERVSRSQVDGTTLSEAKYINLSLTYLEQVIIALHEKSLGNRYHIPYRNSLMTTILKDSLGGNCKTVMISTLSSDSENIDETISTARFSQRCAQLENEIRKNEKIDMSKLVKRLETEKMELMKELSYYQNLANSNGIGKASVKGSIKKPQLTSGSSSNDNSFRNYTEGLLENEEVFQKVDTFLNDNIRELEVKNMDEAQVCFQVMKDIYNTRMKDYVRELTFISEKLQKYDEILSRKKTDKFLQKENQESPSFFERTTSAKKEFESSAKSNLRSNSKNPRVSDSKYFSSNSEQRESTHSRELGSDIQNYNSQINPRQLNFNSTMLKERSSVTSEDAKPFTKKPSFIKTLNSRKKENY